MANAIAEHMRAVRRAEWGRLPGGPTRAWKDVRRIIRFLTNLLSVVRLSVVSGTAPFCFSPPCHVVVVSDAIHAPRGREDEAPPRSYLDAMGTSKKSKSSVRLPSDDAMADDLREAIRAKHRLVEQMKEDVKDGDRDGKGDGSGKPKRSSVWKIVVVVGIIVLFFTMASGASAAEKATRAMRARYAQRRALENEERTKWRSERILRHFGLRRLSQLRHTDPVLTGDDLYVAVRDPDTHFLVVPVSHTVQIETRATKRGGVGLAYVDVPIVSPSSYEPMRENDGLAFETFLRSFLASGSNKGLQVSLRDPRVVVPVIKLLEDAVKRRVLNSPIVLEAEVLPGPNGFLPQMACVFANASAYHDAFLWDDYHYGDDARDDGESSTSLTARAPRPRPPPASCSLRQYTEALAADALVPFDPVGFARTAATRLPGAVLAPGVATGGVPCAGVHAEEGSDADVAWNYEQMLAASGGNVSAEVAAMADKGVDGGFRLDNWRRVSKFARRDAIRNEDVKVFKFDELLARRARSDAEAAASKMDKDDAAVDRDVFGLPSFFSAAKALRAKARADGLHGEVDEEGRKHRRRAKKRATLKRTRSTARAAAAAARAKAKATKDEDAEDADADGSENVRGATRKLHQMDFEMMAEAEALQTAERRAAFAEARSVAARDRAASRPNAYDYAAEAARLLAVPSYGPDIGVQQIRLLRDASWDGDTWFPHSACALSGTAKAHPGFLRDLVNRRLGYAVALRGNVLLTETLRVSLLRELDASRTVLGHDFARLPHGETVTAAQIFVDPVVDDPELALEESEEERALEGAEKDVVGVDYAGAEEELLDEESALWKAKAGMLAKYAKAYARKYGAVEEDEDEETKPAAR